MFSCRDSYVCQNRICSSGSFYLFDFHSFWHIAEHIFVLKLLQTWAGKRWVRAVPWGAAEEGWCLHGWLCKRSLAWPELKRDVRGRDRWHTHPSAEEGGEGFRLWKAGKKERGMSLEVSDDLPDQRLYRPEESKPKCPRRGPEENSVVSLPVCNRC